MSEPGLIERAGRRVVLPGTRWLALCGTPLLAVVLVVCLWRDTSGPPLLEPLLAVPPALAGIGAVTVRRPLVYGGLSLVAAIAIAFGAYEQTVWLSLATIISVVAVTAVSALGTAGSLRRAQKLTDVTSVAEAAQRALLRPLPDRVGPLGLGVVYLSAAAEALVGGDLYEVARTPFGIRLIIGDVRGKGLGAVEIASDVLGIFREVAHEVYTLAEVARRLDAGLTRRWAKHEEFVTALLVEIDPEAGGLTIYNCGHPPPILIARGDRARADGEQDVTVLEVPSPAPPLGLLSLGDNSGASRTLSFRAGDELLLYTDGVTEARDPQRGFYPLDKRLAELIVPNGPGTGLLERLREDLLRHVGAPLDDDAALVLIRAPGAWTAPPPPVSVQQVAQ
jgi:serine phosphatase RsbU (regulator of sigma subunit)